MQQNLDLRDFEIKLQDDTIAKLNAQNLIFNENLPETLNSFPSETLNSFSSQNLSGNSFPPPPSQNLSGNSFPPPPPQQKSAPAPQTITPDLNALPTDLNDIPENYEFPAEQNPENQVPPTPAPTPTQEYQEEIPQDKEEGGSVSSYAGSDLTPQEEENKKKNLLYKLKRFQKKGFTLSRHYTLDSDLVDIQAEVESIKREANLGASVTTMKKGLTISTYLLEMLNDQFDPINAKLNGWSNQVKDDVDQGDYDEVFEELYDKYTDKFQMPPEVRLASMIGTSALQYHVAQIVVNRTLNSSQADLILKENPKIKKDIVNAVNESEIGSKIKATQQQMNNPSDIDNILQELQIEDENSKLISTNF